MKHRTLALFLIAGGVAAVCQSPGPLSEGLNRRYETARLNTLEAAEFMPAEHYQFRLSPAQRMYAEWFAHTVVMNYSMCAAIRGEPAPDVKEPPAANPKPELIAELGKSFAYCDEAYKSMNDQKAWQEREGRNRKYYPADMMINHVVALNEHYGNLVGYLRTKGITPPTTARAEKARKK
jgi:hypothetical protein